MVYLLHKHPCRARSCCHYSAIEIRAVFSVQPKQLHSHRGVDAHARPLLAPSTPHQSPS